jgi:hypothetical protein
MANVNITVKNGLITCSPDPVKVRGGKDTIVFDLVTPGYAFPKQGAVVVQPDAGPDFPEPARTVKGTQATLLDLCTFTASYKYSVTVTDLATGKPVTVDPSIDNGYP